METDFIINDLVRIKEQEYSNYAKNVIWNENVFRILYIDDTIVKLSDIDNAIPINSIEPIPIDGIADACIYYDPVIAADIISPGTPIPIRQKDTSYYVNGLESMHMDDHTLKDEFLSFNFKYVHEVQHWLREDGCQDELDVNKTIKV